MRTIEEIIIHCSATRRGVDFRASDIDRWHRRRGFKSIGYHYVIDLDGTIEIGRDINETGAHCKGHNARSIGICYIGGLASDGRSPEDTRTAAQRLTLKKLVEYLLSKHRRAKVYGHRDFAAKECPCFDVATEL